MFSSFRRVLNRLRHPRPVELSVLEAYARWADSYPSDTPSPFMRLEQETMLEILPDVTGKSALDVGCGTGRYLRILRQRGAAMVAGLDLSPDMLRRARGLGAIVRGDQQFLPILSGRFEIVTSGLVIGYVRHLDRALAEMSRVLSPGGVLVYSDFHPFAALMGHDRRFTVDGRSFRIATHIHLYGAHQAACRAAGLEIEAVREALSSTEPPFPAVLAIRARKRSR